MHGIESTCQMKVDNNVKTKEKGKKVILFKYSTISLWKKLVICYVLRVSSLINFPYINYIIY